MTDDNIIRLADLAGRRRAPGQLRGRDGAHLCGAACRRFSLRRRLGPLDALRRRALELRQHAACVRSRRAICREVALECDKPAAVVAAKTVAAVVTSGPRRSPPGCHGRAMGREPHGARHRRATMKPRPATYDLSTGIARTPDPLDYMTKTTACGAAPFGTPHPQWSAFLDRITAGNAELQAFLQRYVGYCCTGLTTEHAFVFAYGTGANGKSTFINTITRILGDYVAIADMGTFITSNTRAASDRPGQTARRPPGGCAGNPEGPPLGRGEDQGPDRW